MNDKYGCYIPTPEEDRAHEVRLALIRKGMPWRVQSFANVIAPAYRWSGVLTGGHMFPQADTRRADSPHGGGYRASSKTTPYSGIGHKFMRDTDVLDDPATRDYNNTTMQEQIRRDVAEAFGYDVPDDSDSPVEGLTILDTTGEPNE